MVKVFKWNASGDSVSPTKKLEDAKKNDESIRSRSGWLHIWHFNPGLVLTQFKTC